MPQHHTDIFFMKRCIQLAQQGLGSVAPNPMVGAVIVHNNTIIGEGYHQNCGEAHAEVNAINSVKNKSLLPYSTIYVSLEPCAHFGKTPPCANLIIENKILRVVIGMQDPFSKVNGAGIKRLNEAGCTVKVGVLENECRDLIREFIVFHTKKRPYVILKWAQTLDGLIDKEREPNAPRQPNWITNEVCRSVVHKWRTQVQSIMVGTNTALADNPKLNVRSWVGASPLRIVIDQNLRLPDNLNLFDQSINTLVFNAKHTIRKENLEFIKIDFNGSFVELILQELRNRDISSIFVEGGQQLLKTFIDKNLWDEARIFTGNKKFIKGIQAPTIPLKPVIHELLGDNLLSIYYNK